MEGAPEAGAPTGFSRRRLLLFYAGLALATVVIAALVLTEGAKRNPPLVIAGGYDVSGDEPDPCLGRQFALQQSGRFVSLDDRDGAVSGQLEFVDGRLRGEISCAAQGVAALDARVAEGTLSGTLGDRSVRAELRREAPEPGTARQRPPASIAGEYRLDPRSDCLGSALEIERRGEEFEAAHDGADLGVLAYDDGHLSGRLRCKGGGAVAVTGEATDRQLNLQLAPAGGDAAGGGEEPEAERLTARRQREFGHTVAAFFIAVAVVMLVARAFGAAAAKIGQPRVMGEVVAGIALGPTILGTVAPDLKDALFPTDILPFIGVVANLGLIFYMFLIGLEIEPRHLRGRLTQAAAISNASVALPMMLGLVVALPLYEVIAPPNKFVGFALFMGVAMSITAFPVLGRILVERRMLKRPVGALTLACAAIDDVTAWFLIALATAVAVAGGFGDVVTTIALALAFCLFMALIARPLLSRVSRAYDEAGRVPGAWIAAIFAGVLLSAYATEMIGIALIFGAFVMGLIMPRHAELTEDVTRRVEDFVVTLLLPLFFTYTGLKTNVGLLDRPELWLITGLLLAVAIVGKLFGAMAAARLTGFDWRSSAVIGTLMNTRGLTELIVLNLALEKGAISEALFASLVIMALVTTFMAGPALKLLDPRNELGAPVEEELEEAREEAREALPPTLPVPERSILVAPQADGALPQLMSLAEPLGRSEPPRELIVARLVQPPRGASTRGAMQTESRLLERAFDEVTDARQALIGRGVAARSVAFVSADPGGDLARLARSEEVDMILLDGRRPLLGEGVPRGEVGEVLEHAPCDVAVLVAPANLRISAGPEAPVVVPFGGLEHDWAALELGAWVASVTGARLKLLGAAREDDTEARVTRLLGDASLLVQQYAGIVAEPLVVTGGQQGLVERTQGAGLLVVGLSERWRQEGLGPTRSALARAATAPVIFVRRGTRPGALAPREDVTRFTWSAPALGEGYVGGILRP